MGAQGGEGLCLIFWSTVDPANLLAEVWFPLRRNAILVYAPGDFRRRPESLGTISERSPM